ncbi:hypothetical protein HRI_003131800 [Hibiscus trionum]|uniref:Uncharacterized protein n=1 Tax=Hibiscus trionum TaxID=183268 RepID=A0A9W7MDV0_HIBTR|nr:hypothetical protein HRI_003131800 [Hibiscus trionum]
MKGAGQWRRISDILLCFFACEAVRRGDQRTLEGLGLEIKPLMWLSVIPSIDVVKNWMVWRAEETRTRARGKLKDRLCQILRAGRGPYARRIRSQLFDVFLI